jgi:sugar (pentulose or hexulose) kinase
MSAPLLLGVDLGTSYFKVGLFDEAGALRGLGRVAVPKTEPAPGRCELAVADFWRTLRAGFSAALAQAGAAPQQVTAMSYSSQASTFLLLDARDRPLTPLILWLDARGEPVAADDLAFAGGDLFRRTIGFEGLSGQTAVAKWRWWQRHEAEGWRRAARVMTLSDYLTFALTGERVGDASTAAFLGLLDVAACDWWPAALAHFGIDATQLSRPLRPGTVVGKTCAAATPLLGLGAGVDFAVGGLDHHIAAVGAGIGVRGEASLSTGTVLAALALVEAVAPRAGCFHGPHFERDRYYCLAFDPAGAGQIEEYQRRAAPGIAIETLLAEATDPGRETPHGPAMRAILDRIARSHRRLVERTTDFARVRGVLATGGGARSEGLLQNVADVLARPVTVPACPESACLGAAMLAAAANGRYSSVEEAARTMARTSLGFEPRR